MEPNHYPAYLSDNPPANGEDYIQPNLVHDLQLRLEVKTRQVWELTNELKAKNEKIGDQSRTIIRLRDELSQANQELDKERTKSSELLNNLEGEKGQRLKLEEKIAQFEKFIMQGAKTLFGRNTEEESSTRAGEGAVVTVQSTSSGSSQSVGMSTPTQQQNHAIQPVLAKMPPQTPKHNLKRKNEIKEEAGRDLESKRALQINNQQQNNISEGSKLRKVLQKSIQAPAEQLPETTTQIPTTTQQGTSALPADPKEFQSDAQPELPILPPLVFQFQSTQIKMGMFIEGRPQILKNPSGSESTPFVVGITSQERTLHYGDEVTSILNMETDQDPPESGFWKVWWVASKLIKCGNDAWSASPIVRDGKRQMITVEFLIGFIVKKLKSHVETMMNGTCHTAVITVPFWYSSSQRIQMKDGVRLAGFNKVYLVNEGPASVFGCPSRDSKISTSHNILVLSENSNQIDASIYSYNSYTSGAKRLIMIGHSGHYSQVDTMTGGADPPKTGCMEEAIVQQLCALALKNMEDKKHNPVKDTTPPKELITVSESKIWGPILEQVGKQFVTTFDNLDMDNETAVVIGATILSQKPEEIQTIISDKLAHDVLAKCDNDQSKISIIPKENVLGIHGINITHTFPAGCQFLKIFQTVLDRPIELFRMALVQPIAPTERMTITLTVTNEGIVKFKELAYTSTSHNTANVKKARIEDYSWKAPNLSLGSLLKAKDLVEYFALLDEDESREGVPNANIDAESKDIKDPSSGIRDPSVDIAGNPIPTMEEVREQMANVAKQNLSLPSIE